jgi:hypothetical protein
MNMIKCSEESLSPNVLKAVHLLFTISPIALRDKIEEECGWSTPTFYRKMKVCDALSNAEKDKIIQIALEWVQHLQESCSNLAGSSKTN